MSSSIFDSGYSWYPETKYVEGDKKFGELVKGDVIYNYCIYTQKLSKFVVRKGLHVKDGRFVISVKAINDARKSIYVDFGECNCQNVLWAEKMSVVFDYDGNVTYGTNPKSLILEQKFIIEKSIEQEKSKLSYLEHCLSVLGGLQEELKKG